MVDEELIFKVKAKDMSAFRRLYDFYRERVYFTAYSILRDKQLSEDALQEVFVKVYTRINDLKVPQRFEVWLYRITINAARDIYSKKRLLSYVSLEDDEGNTMEIADDSEESIPEQIVLNREASKELVQAVYELPEHHRIPLILYYFNNMNIEDIAFIMECSSGTIKSRLHHGKNSLRKKLLNVNRKSNSIAMFEGRVKLNENR